MQPETKLTSDIIYSYKDLCQHVYPKTETATKKIAYQHYQSESTNYVVGPSYDELGSFIVFGSPNVKGKPCDKFSEIAKKYELKFHFSIAEEPPEVFNRGCDILIKLLIEAGFGTFKLSALDVKMSASEHPDQRGKIATLYMNESPEFTVEKMKSFLQKLTTKLAEEKIPPGYRPPGDDDEPEFPVEGCNYGYFRFSRLPKLSYEYNHEREGCLRYANALSKKFLKVTNVKQLPIPEWKPLDQPKDNDFDSPHIYVV